MNQDRLRTDLADLAEEVTPVDLRDRALRTSRRLGIQRAIATSAAAVVMVGAATGTAFALMPRADRPAPIPADTPSVTVVPSPTEASETASPSVTPSNATEAPPAAIGGLVYGPMTAGEGSSTTVRLYSWQPGVGEDPTRLLELSRDVAILNAAVSPDGKRVAWVERDATLWVADRDGSDRRKLRDDVDGQCWTPTWSPDSRQLAVGTLVPGDTDAYRSGVIDVASRQFTEFGRADGCHPVWSGDGQTIAYADGSEGRVILAAPSGKGTRFIPDLGGNARYSSFDLASLSPDGSRLALYRRGPDVPSGDVGRELDVNVVLDTRSGEPVSLELGGRELRQAYFQADGTLVARVKSGGGIALVLLDTDGRRISESPEPAALKDMQILAVTN